MTLTVYSDYHKRWGEIDQRNSRDHDAKSKEVEIGIATISDEDFGGMFEE